ncbi:sigma-70 family RNA polymerase sigma factor [Nocardioides sp. MAHUQ-72]|uniref:sigma-70 family RNA polymerase sigma factor n=1 Tax=unclassified Nocardioides TaxID=2615069 RepID=UPI00360D8D45
MQTPDTELHAQRRHDQGSRRATRRADTVKLLKEASSTDSASERARLLDEAIRLNLDVAGDIARRYHGRGIPDDDIDQVANLGLVKAVHGFDPSRGNDFLSYAVPTVRGEVRRYFRDCGWTIRPPRVVQEIQTRIADAEGALYQQLGRSPRPSEIARHLGIEPDVVREALAANGCFTPSSLDSVGTDGEAPGSRMGGADPGFDNVEARVVLKSLLTDLTPRERRLLEMRFFGGCTQAEIGADIGVTQMQVSRLLSRLLARLRERLESEHVGGAA